jgi:hypothetical protein
MNKNEEIQFIDQCIDTINEVGTLIEENGLVSEVEGSEEYLRGRKDGYISALEAIKNAFIELKRNNLYN